VAAAGALALLGLGLGARPGGRWPLAAGLLLSALLAGGILALLSQRLNYKLQRELTRAVELAREHGPVPAGQTELTYFKRAGCSHCAAFERDILPALRQEFGSQLQVVEAAAWSGIPTPTLVIRGRFEALLYLDPTREEVQQLVREELGGGTAARAR
jgi:hypothetical protein